jgi:PHD/YefM family antitoxin component YafN of YafNO toxin-antitoxin module
LKLPGAMRAQREPVAVSSHGQITGYFVSPDEYEEFKRFRESRRSFDTANLLEDKAEAVGSSCMHPRHADLDKMLDPK